MHYCFCYGVLQKIRTIELDGKTVKLQIVSTRVYYVFSPGIITFYKSIICAKLGTCKNDHIVTFIVS